MCFPVACFSCGPRCERARAAFPADHHAPEVVRDVLVAVPAEDVCGIGIGGETVHAGFATFPANVRGAPDAVGANVVHDSLESGWLVFLAPQHGQKTALIPCCSGHPKVFICGGSICKITFANANELLHILQKSITTSGGLHCSVYSLNFTSSRIMIPFPACGVRASATQVDRNCTTPRQERSPRSRGRTMAN